jgi:hypothetical protein
MESWREKYCRVDEGLQSPSCALAVLLCSLSSTPMKKLAERIDVRQVGFGPTNERKQAGYCEKMGISIRRFQGNLGYLDGFSSLCSLFLIFARSTIDISEGSK